MHVTHTSFFNEKWFNEINYGVWDLNFAWWKITRILKDISSHFTKTPQMIHWWNYSRKMAKQNLYLPDKLQQRTKQILFSFLLAILFVITPTSADGDKYYGAYVGNFENRFHGIRGEVRYQIYFYDYDHLQCNKMLFYQKQDSIKTSFISNRFMQLTQEHCLSKILHTMDKVPMHIFMQENLENPVAKDI